MVYKRRRTIRKRPRRYKGRSMRRMAPRSNIRADSTYTEKLTYNTDLYVNNNEANFDVHWVRSGISAANEQFPVGSVTGNR